MEVFGLKKTQIIAQFLFYESGNTDATGANSAKVTLDAQPPD